MIIDYNQHPIDTIYYISACIMYELSECKTINIETLYIILKEKYNSDLGYVDYVLALDFLFLVEFINVSNGEVKNVSKKAIPVRK